MNIMEDNCNQIFLRCLSLWHQLLFITARGEDGWRWRADLNNNNILLLITII